MSYNFNTDPYFDDYDELKDYLRILFRPGTAVQARELTQIQSILQNQVDSIGKHLFKNGSPVVDGRLNYSPRTDYVKIIPPSTGVVLSDLEGLLYTGATSGVTGTIIHTETSDSTDTNDVIYVRYISSGTSGETTFQANENITSSGATLTVQSDASSNVVSGLGSMLSISNGIYYIDGFFVKVVQSNLILNRYDSTPSFTCGLAWEHDITTSATDLTLNDNATGSPNYAAPGAHRYSISTTFVKYPLTVNSEGNLTNTESKPRYLELYRAEVGITRLMQDTPNYSVVEHELAKRTYNESGDYVVRDFIIDFIEDRNNFVETWVASSNYIIGDVIREDVGGLGLTYTYKCVTAGTSGSNKPTFLTTFSTFTDGGVTWQFVEKVHLNSGAYPAIPPVTTPVTYAGQEDKYIAEISNGIGVVKGFSHTQTGKLKLRNDRARDIAREDASTVSVSTPKYVLIDLPSALPSQMGTEFIDFDIYNEFSLTPGTAVGTKIGTCKARWIERHNSTVGNNEYRVYIHDISIDSGYIFSRNAKCLYIDTASAIGSANFTGNITQSYDGLTGAIDGSTGSANITGIGTKFTEELKVGDYITADSGVNKYKIGTITATTLTVTPNLAADITSSVFSISNSYIANNDNNAVYKLTHNFIKDLKSADGISSDTDYFITRKLGTQSTLASTTTLTFPLTGDETFAPITPQNYTVINASTGSIINPHTITRSNANQLITVSGLSNSTSYAVFGTVRRSNSQASTKTISVGTFDLTTSNVINISKILLDKADCTKLLSVKVAPAFGTIDSSNDATKDITSQYKLNSGQSNLYYGIGSIERNTASDLTGSIRIYFEYHDHSFSSDRDFFSVESYISTDYTNIQPNLRDSIDFRPVQNDNGVGFKNANFGILKYDNDVSLDYSYYLPRMDGIVLTPKKEIKIIKGESSLTPQMPTLPEGSMLLYTLGNVPYGGVLPSSVKVKKKNNRRYTMKDIGKLDKRIDNLEYYTSLSMLELETSTTEVKDPDGFSLFKNGFIVDSFNDMGVGDLKNPDYKCFINTGAGELRSPIIESHIKLKENGTISDRISNNYVVNSNIVTLPYTEKEYVGNSNSSRVSNVNPFAVVSFIGVGELTPESDIWTDTDTLPVIRDSNY
jgi:hypothetical protein